MRTTCTGDHVPVDAVGTDRCALTIFRYSQPRVQVGEDGQHILASYNYHRESWSYIDTEKGCERVQRLLVIRLDKDGRPRLMLHSKGGSISKFEGGGQYFGRPGSVSGERGSALVCRDTVPLFVPPKGH